MDGVVQGITRLISIAVLPCQMEHGTKLIYTSSADASEITYGAVGYLRIESSSEVSLAFVMAKCRVAPLKLVTIPRLELCAAVVATRLATTIKRELGLEIQETTFHSNSISSAMDSLVQM